MKTTIIKMLVVIACMTLGIANVAKAQQTRSRDVVFYSQVDDHYYAVIKFDGNMIWVADGLSGLIEYIKKNLGKDPNYYENRKYISISEIPSNVNLQTFLENNKADREKNKWDYARAYYYCPSKSTAAYNVYIFIEKGKYSTYHPVDHIAISQDRSSMITWSETGHIPGDECNKTAEDIKYRHIYSRVPKEDLLPKSANYDFLND